MGRVPDPIRICPGIAQGADTARGGAGFEMRQKRGGLAGNKTRYWFGRYVQLWILTTRPLWQNLQHSPLKEPSPDEHNVCHIPVARPGPKTAFAVVDRDPAKLGGVTRSA